VAYFYHYTPTILQNYDSLLGCIAHQTHKKSLSLCEIMLPHYIYKVC